MTSSDNQGTAHNAQATSLLPLTASSRPPKLPRPSDDRLARSFAEKPLDLSVDLKRSHKDVTSDDKKPDTILYLAYGSNLCSQTFLGMRGIRPLAALNVVVPELLMTFDLPGIPYAEPCFANTRFWKDNNAAASQRRISPASSGHPGQRQHHHPIYTNPIWPKGMVGVVYEVTLSDFAHIIATEGGGSAYQDILITCHELPSGTDTVPLHPSTGAFKAHTLYTPPEIIHHDPSSTGTSPPTRMAQTRPDPDYAQPSSRYLTLLRTGADEHDIPQEYKRYLHALQPYTITTRRQRIGATIFLGIWGPLVLNIRHLSKRFADKRSGRSPQWLVTFMRGVFRAMWMTYDGAFKPMFGDGERTIEAAEERMARKEEEDEEEGQTGSPILAKAEKEREREEEHEDGEQEGKQMGKEEMQEELELEREVHLLV